LVEAAAPGHWQLFDAVVSASVLEHIPKASQGLVLRRLSDLLRPGGWMAISFDYGDGAPQPGAIRDALEVHRLVAASGLAYPDHHLFEDTGERFALDRRHPRNRFTFGSLFLRKG
jgi:2-polyprenyl-3-methyl-5-hydroxy-6-metoxy-1,4-benzoquinol methylase